MSCQSNRSTEPRELLAIHIVTRCVSEDETRFLAYASGYKESRTSPNCTTTGVSIVSETFAVQTSTSPNRSASTRCKVAGRSDTRHRSNRMRKLLLTNAKNLSCRELTKGLG